MPKAKKVAAPKTKATPRAPKDTTKKSRGTLGAITLPGTPIPDWAK